MTAATQAPVNQPPSPAAPRRPRVLLLAGGQSEEHAVSLSSARSVLAALPQDRFEVTAVVVTKQGRWLPAAQSAQVLASGAAEVAEGGELVLAEAQQASGFDVVFPLLHGPRGEDGTVQGLLTLAGLPFVGSGVLASSVCMDKIMTKRVLEQVGIPQVAWRGLSRSEWQHNTKSAGALANELGYPLFVKPANMGSSVGISRVEDEGELQVALRLAFSLDRRVIVEAAASSRPREVEVGILGNDAPIASPVGELRFEADFYDYDAKYSGAGAEMLIPAPLPAEVSRRVQKLALEAYRALDCAGLARIDFFYLEDTGEVLLNEVNTMPGFTATSMYPSLLQAQGFSYPELVARLIELALEDR